jgi:hypothetical protein
MQRRTLRYVEQIIAVVIGVILGQIHGGHD